MTFAAAYHLAQVVANETRTRQFVALKRFTTNNYEFGPQHEYLALRDAGVLWNAATMCDPQ